jgi:hypothetical protein
LLELKRGMAGPRSQCSGGTTTPRPLSARFKVRNVKDGDEVAEVTEIKLWDKNTALEKLCKHLGMFVADKSHGDDKRGGPITDLTESEMLELLQMRQALRARDVTARKASEG